MLLHTQTLEQYFQALNNGDVQGINAVKNNFEKFFGATPPNTVDAMKQIVGSELAKAVVGNRSGEEERKTLADKLSTANSMAQIKDVVDGLRELGAGQLYDQNVWWKAATNGKRPGAFEQYLNPIAQRSLVRETAKNEAPSAPLDAKVRTSNTVYNTPRGPMTWTGTGWVPMQ